MSGQRPPRPARQTAGRKNARQAAGRGAGPATCLTGSAAKPAVEPAALPIGGGPTVALPQPAAAAFAAGSADTLAMASDGLQAALQSLGLPLAPAQQDQLTAYAALLQRWNAVHNLTALRDPRQMLTHHLIDCLAAVPALLRHAGGRRLKVLDVGSGGGLPGLAWAIAVPEWPLHAVDAVAKKAAFLRQAAGELGLAPRVQALHGRVESLKLDGGYDLIASRAVGPLAELVTWSAHLLAPKGVWVAMKGQVPDDEIAALPARAEVFHVEPLQVPGLDAQRCLVWMRPRNAAGRSAT